MLRPPVAAHGLSAEQVAETEAFMRANLALTEVPGTGLRLHLAHPRSGLSRLVPPGGTPYWAHAWPGGVALAMHLAAAPEAVRGCLAIDVGAGSGLVGLAAQRAGADSLVALDSDPLAAVATRVNAGANDLPAPICLSGPPGRLAGTLGLLRVSQPRVVLAGDVFYNRITAKVVAAALDAMERGATILVGDIGRRFLPRDRLEPLASYPVRDLGDPPTVPLREGWVFRWKRS